MFIDFGVDQKVELVGLSKDKIVLILRGRISAFALNERIAELPAKSLGQFF